MDQLIVWHLAHEKMGVAPEVEAAWLHHRFALIHPFQDGNGRVARLLASLIFIRADGFPLVITRDDREEYIDALEIADRNGLGPLIQLFARAQQRAYRSALDLADQSLAETVASPSVEAIIADVATIRTQAQNPSNGKAEALASRLFAIAEARFQKVAKDIQDTKTLAQVWSVQTEPAGASVDWLLFIVLQLASKFDYLPNLTHFQKWVKLELEDGIEILFALHGLGQRYQSILLGVACAYRKGMMGNEDETGMAYSLEPLSSSPFQITEYDDFSELETRFEKWLENVLIAGLTYWRRGLTS
jgi:hypothetical protein